MDAFNELRQEARERRDAEIEKIKVAYRSELAEINALAKRMTRKPSLKGQSKPTVPLREQIMEVAPHDETFTVYDILERLKLAVSEKPRVRTTFDRLMQRKEIKRVRRGRKDVPAIFARHDFELEVSPLNQMSQIEAAATVLREIGPSDITTLIVAMQYRGFTPLCSLRGLRKSLRSALGSNPDLFSQIKGKWVSCVAPNPNKKARTKSGQAKHRTLTMS